MAQLRHKSQNLWVDVGWE